MFDLMKERIEQFKSRSVSMFGNESVPDAVNWEFCGWLQGYLARLEEEQIAEQAPEDV